MDGSQDDFTALTDFLQKDTGRILEVYHYYYYDYLHGKISQWGEKKPKSPYKNLKLVLEILEFFMARNMSIVKEVASN